MYEFLCTLQPSPDSVLLLALNNCQLKCIAELGVDETALFPPHVSVTGFFSATLSQAAAVCASSAMLVASAKPGSLSVEVGEALATDTGHALLDIKASGLADLALALAMEAEAVGLRLRPKAVRHMSLAAGRPPNERSRIADIYSDVGQGRFHFDLVIAQIVHRSNLEQLRKEGLCHEFVEIQRLRLPRADEPLPLWSMPMPLSVSTPLRKRPHVSDSQFTPKKYPQTSTVRTVPRQLLWTKGDD